MSSLKRKSQVVLLTTTNKSNLTLDRQNKLTYFKELTGAGLRQHLYFLSEDKIEEGDWFLTDVRDRASDNNGIPIWELRKCKHIKNSWIFTEEESIGLNPDWSKKIIATTNISLGLPQPSQEFIEKYKLMYNNGVIITKIMVDYVKEMCTVPFEGNCHCLNNEECKKPIEKIKVDKHNCITITRVKDTWSREEVEQLCFQAFINYKTKEGKIKPSEVEELLEPFNKWLKENL